MGIPDRTADSAPSIIHTRRLAYIPPLKERERRGRERFNDNQTWRTGLVANGDRQKGGYDRIGHESPQRRQVSPKRRLRLVNPSALLFTIRARFRVSPVPNSFRYHIPEDDRQETAQATVVIQPSRRVRVPPPCRFRKAIVLELIGQTDSKGAWLFMDRASATICGWGNEANPKVRSKW